MELTRRHFLTLAGAAGATAVGAGMMGCSPKAPLTDPADGTGKADTTDSGAAQETVDYASLATSTVDCDVVVVGLGVSGVAAFRAATEAGLHVIGVEKCSNPNCRSAGFAAFGTEKLDALGGGTLDPAEICNELMIQMAHRANYLVNMKWLKHCGEAFEWYCDAYEGLLWLGPDDPEPEEPEPFYVCMKPFGSDYRFGVDHEREFSSGALVGGNELYTHRPILEANIEKAVAAGSQTVFNSPAVQLIKEDGRITGVICENLADETYTRYNVKKGVILASGDYSFNDDMLKQYAPWIYQNKDKYLFSHEAIDMNGNHASTGDGQRMGMEVGGHVDVAPHAVMAHIYQFGAEEFLEVNEHGERFCNEDLSMTNIAKVMAMQPGSKVFQIVGDDYNEYFPGMEMVMQYMRGEGFAAEADTLDGLADQLGFTGKHKTNFLDAVARYNELCAKGKDEDFGKAAKKMHPIDQAPFRAVTYDMLKHTSVDDVSCMRLLVTMGGLVTDDCARVLDDASDPIPGLYAVGNTQGGRFVDDYPFTLYGASHAAALTYGYLAGKQIAED